MIADVRGSRCPVPGCGVVKEPRHAMCRDHWRAVSPPVKQLVTSEFRRFGGRVSARPYVAALRLAIAEVSIG